MSLDQDQHREDEAILAALEGLDAAGRDLPEATDPLVREYRELLGLLPYELEPVAPRPELRGLVLDRVSSRRRSEAGATVLPFRPVERERPAPVARGLWAMAAVLAICLFGMGYLLGKTREQATTIDRLESAFQQAHLGDLLTAQDDLDMIQRVARIVYPMQPMVRTGGPATASGSTGRVWVCGEHQRWLLQLEDLTPPPKGYEYQLWFLTADGRKVNAGTLEVRGTTGRLRAPSMPVDTQGFLVSLETCGEHPEPEGEVLLMGDEPVSL